MSTRLASVDSAVGNSAVGWFTKMAMRPTLAWVRFKVAEQTARDHHCDLEAGLQSVAWLAPRVGAGAIVCLGHRLLCGPAGSVKMMTLRKDRGVSP